MLAKKKKTEKKKKKKKKKKHGQGKWGGDWKKKGRVEGKNRIIEVVGKGPEMGRANDLQVIADATSTRLLHQ